MIGLDTNVLVRYVVQDDPKQGKAATHAIDAGTKSGESFFIAHIVLCEFVWVLESAYRYSRETVSPVLEKILRTRQFTFETKDLLWQALADYRQGKADFADYLIGHVGSEAGCEQVLTFDQVLAAEPGFELPK